MNVMSSVVMCHVHVRGLKDIFSLHARASLNFRMKRFRARPAPALRYLDDREHNEDQSDDSHEYEQVTSATLLVVVPVEKRHREHCGSKRENNHEKFEHMAA